MPKQLKLTSWNVEHLDKLVSATTTAATRRRNAVVEEIELIDPDVLCIIEGPKGEAAITSFCQHVLGGAYQPVLASDGEYATLGTQWIWFLVKNALHSEADLLPISTWQSWAGNKWPVHYWGAHQTVQHKHYRHPQTLILNWLGQRIECIGLHLKSKFINQTAKSDWNAGGAKREKVIVEAIKARIKLTTEATNVRAYIDAKFQQVANPAIFVMGDLNDGPGKELIENQYLFFDLISNVQGDVFFARRFLNHCLFDAPQELRWSVHFQDYMDPARDPHILLDHILFTQGLVDDSLPIEVKPHAGKVEHEAHELANAGVPAASKTSDHRPVSVVVSEREAD